MVLRIEIECDCAPVLSFGPRILLLCVILLGFSIKNSSFLLSLSWFNKIFIPVLNSYWMCIFFTSAYGLEEALLFRAPTPNPCVLFWIRFEYIPIPTYVLKLLGILLAFVENVLLLVLGHDALISPVRIPRIAFVNPSQYWLTSTPILIWNWYWVYAIPIEWLLLNLIVVKTCKFHIRGDYTEVITSWHCSVSLWL